MMQHSQRCRRQKNLIFHILLLPLTDYNWGYDPSTYLKTPGLVKEVFFINQGRTRGTTFKIDTGGYVFSCLFHTGAKVSCMNMETCTTLGLLHSISDTNTQVNTASGQDMGIVGHVMVTFKLGKQSFTQKFLVCRFLTRPFILGEEIT